MAGLPARARPQSPFEPSSRAEGSEVSGISSGSLQGRLDGRDHLAFPIWAHRAGHAGALGLAGMGATQSFLRSLSERRPRWMRTEGHTSLCACSLCSPSWESIQNLRLPRHSFSSSQSWDSNLGPHAHRASVLPLSHTPGPCPEFLHVPRSDCKYHLTPR